MSFLKKTSPWHHASRVAMIIGGMLFVLVLSRSVYERYQVEKMMRERREAAETELAELQERYERLESEIDYLSGARGVEEEIRQQFDVARPGEQVVVLVGAEAVPTVAATSSDSLPEAAWYEFWRLWR